MTGCDKNTGVFLYGAGLDKPVIEEVRSSDEPLGVRELAERLDAPVSEVSHPLRRLKAEGKVELVDGGYRYVE